MPEAFQLPEEEPEVFESPEEAGEIMRDEILHYRFSIESIIEGDNGEDEEITMDISMTDSTYAVFVEIAKKLELGNVYYAYILLTYFLENADEDSQFLYAEADEHGKIEILRDLLNRFGDDQDEEEKMLWEEGYEFNGGKIWKLEDEYDG